MEYWMELRTALMVARLGTVSAAASALGVHRATVNRHVETLEGELGAPLFQRHARGYSLTDAGHDMLEVSSRAEEMFSDLAGRSRGRAGRLTGSLVITAVAGVAPLVMPAIRDFYHLYPNIQLEFAASEQLARLEYGEAHVAIRAGARPEVPDYVVTLFRPVRFGLYASKDYIKSTGLPVSDQIKGHRFVGHVGKSRSFPYADWMAANVSPESISLWSSDQQVIKSAICAGLGMGFMAEHDAQDQPDLIEVIPPSKEWSVNLWIVTHGDLHHTTKVQAFLAHVKALRASANT